MATIKKPVKKYAMGGPMTTTSETTKKPKYVPTAREKKNLEDASSNKNAKPIFTVKEQIERRKKLGLPTSEKEEKEYYAKMAREGGRNGKVVKKAKSGAKFDLNKDGKTTFKDVLIGRGVLPKNAKSGGKMKKAQTGDKLYPTSGVGKDVPAKNGKSMKKCKYGCK